LGRKSPLVNLPYRAGLLPVQNRYRSWAALAGVPYESIATSYRDRQGRAAKNRTTAIHVGAQWRSKQYPEVAHLSKALRERGLDVKILAGPDDHLPPSVF